MKKTGMKLWFSQKELRTTTLRSGSGEKMNDELLIYQDQRRWRAGGGEEGRRRTGKDQEFTFCAQEIFQRRTKATREHGWK
ncbi:hypothetical protein NPIL_452661 [Nephila pilipes]|uniref:Uncharacterized protein n=1 Tax=Nephila pilipes TaxID=299642 RepID=A0A8X6N1Z1_NEPPI|nr:hypothetical protein NPIL_452661 [Nephila pilipes]